MLTVDFDKAFSPGRFLRDMQRLQGEVNQEFPRSNRPASTAFPAFNVWGREDGAILTCELPGVDPADLQISVVGDTLTLQGKRNQEASGEGRLYHRRERVSGNFNRVLQFPFRVEAGEVSADFKNGVLTITLPQAHADRPRKIQVKSE